MIAICCVLLARLPYNTRFLPIYNQLLTGCYADEPIIYAVFVRIIGVNIAKNPEYTRFFNLTN